MAKTKISNSPEATRIAMEKALEMYRENPSLTDREVSLALGRNDRCVELWKQRNTQGFREKYVEAMRESFENLEGVAIKCMKDLIVEDRSFQAAKYVLDNRGYKAEDKLKADVNGGMDLTITIGD